MSKETLDDYDKSAMTEFEDILDLTTSELLKKAINENWQVKHVEFWLKVRNLKALEDQNVLLGNILETLEVRA